MSLLSVDDIEHPPRRGQVIEVEDRLVHVLRQGVGMPVLLLHGNGSLGEEILSAFPDTAGVEWIAPDRPGYGLSAPFPKGQEDPRRYAKWLAALIDALDLGRVVVAAHSISAGAALWLATDHPARVAGLVLLAPFCRPTPHRWMPGLRLAVAPVVGGVVRKTVLPAVLPRVRSRMLGAMVAPDPVPPWLARFPLRHATRPRAIVTLAAKLRRFNDGMERLGHRTRLRVPVTAIFGEVDRTADPGWHGPWLAARAPGLRVVSLPGVGHAVHHAAPGQVVGAVVDAVGRALPPDIATHDEPAPALPPVGGQASVVDIQPAP
jgi:pimeloyl-ACP methyl ester carboxylesterase